MDRNKNALVAININGKVVSGEDAKISVFDRGFLFGDSIYEVTRTYDGKIFLIKEHFERLFVSAAKINMDIPFTKDFLREEIQKTVDHLGIDNVFIRLIITRGEGGFSLDPAELSPNNLVILVKELTPYPEKWYRDGVHVIIANTHRTTKDTVDPNIKSGNYLNNVMAFMEATKQKVYDSIMLNKEGHVTEATTSNIWIVKDNEVITPPLKAGILEGITRKTILKLAAEKHIHIAQRDFTPDDLINADECFLTSSTKEVIPVTQVDGSPIGAGVPGDMTKRLHRMYKDYIAQYTGS